MMRCENERKSPSSSPRLDCEVGLGLRMQLQTSDSYSSGGGVPFFRSTGNQVGCLNDMYGVADGAPVQTSFHNSASRPSGGKAVSGKSLFTATQWKELERQKTIHKYIMASIPVPPQLLLPISKSSPPSTSLSQCNTSGMDLRFSSSGIDPEPWRCKRTDGKKWRCSRDVAPDQKYCERHAHKNKPRSRKLVELSSHNTSNNNPYSHKPLTTTTLQPLQSASQFSTPSFDQTRCIEWFMGVENDTNSLSTRKQQQWEQVMQKKSSSSSRMDLNRGHTYPHKDMSVYLPHFEEEQGLTALNPYIPDTSHLDTSENHNSIFNPKMKSLQEGTRITRHFFGDASLSKNFPVSPSSSPLSLGWNHDSEKGSSGIGKMSLDRGNDGIYKPQWMTPPCWMNSSSPPPGGPLGEALCLGNANTTRGGMELASPQGYSYSNTNTNSSSCSKSSCEEGSHALDFIG